MDKIYCSQVTALAEREELESAYIRREIARLNARIDSLRYINENMLHDAISSVMKIHLEKKHIDIDTLEKNIKKLAFNQADILLTSHEKNLHMVEESSHLEKSCLSCLYGRPVCQHCSNSLDKWKSHKGAVEKKCTTCEYMPPCDICGGSLHLKWQPLKTESYTCTSCGVLPTVIRIQFVGEKMRHENRPSVGV